MPKPSPIPPPLTPALGSIYTVWKRPSKHITTKSRMTTTMARSISHFHGGFFSRDAPSQPDRALLHDVDGCSKLPPIRQVNINPDRASQITNMKSNQTQ